MGAEHYTYRVRWSVEDDAFVGAVAEMPSLSWVADTQDEAFSGIRELVDQVVADMRETGEVPPEPISERSYSGRFVVRIPPEVHRALAIAAVEQRVSLNRLAAARLGAA